MDAWDLVPVGFVLAAALLARRMPDPTMATLLLESRWASSVLGLLASVVTWWMWGSLNQFAVIHDEFAYLLQSAIFASGHLAAPGPPLPAFFEQYHVLVSPMLAPKYPPGQALIMVPGVWLGLPGLVPVLLDGLAGGLVFALARRIANPWVAAMTWVMWLIAPLNLVWRTTYLSEPTTSAAWLAACWALLEWRRTSRRRWLVILALALAWALMTRPLTAIAMAIPIAFVVLRLTAARRGWRDLALALASGACVLLILPAWNAASTGDWRTLPYVYYSRVYFPYQKLGFGVDPTSGLRDLPPDMRVFDSTLKQMHRAHTVEALPWTLWSRATALGRDTWGGEWWRRSLVALAVAGLAGFGPEMIFGLATAASVLLSYLFFAHPAFWSAYYLEIQPVLAFCTAVGIWNVLTALVKWKTGGRAVTPAPTPTRQAFAALLILAAFVTLGFQETVTMRALLLRRYEYYQSARDLFAGIPDAKAIVFVRYGPRHNTNLSLIQNVPNLDRARLWFVYDRGEDNRRLIRLASDRSPYLFDEANGRLSRLPH